MRPDGKSHVEVEEKALNFLELRAKLNVRNPWLDRIADGLVEDFGIEIDGRLRIVLPVGSPGSSKRVPLLIAAKISVGPPSTPTALNLAQCDGDDDLLGMCPSHAARLAHPQTVSVSLITCCALRKPFRNRRRAR